VQTLVFDIETDGLLDELTKIHCMSVRVHGKKTVYRFRNTPAMDTLAEGLQWLMKADVICGHNIIRFDIPAIKKVYPGFEPKGKVLDTFVMAKLIWTDLKDRDAVAMRKGKIPRNIYGKQSLEAWGYRLGNYKGDFKGPWGTWTPEMDDYCEQDVRVTDDLLTLIETKKYSPEALDLEHKVAQIVWRQEEYGFGFDTDAGGSLYAQLVKKKKELEAQLQDTFKPWYVPKDGWRAPGTAKSFTPKANNKRYRYTKDCPMTRVKLVEFNAASRDHIADRLIKLRGWKPSVFTGGGKPQVDEVVISKLKYPEAPILSEYLTVDKRISQLAEGTQAWLKQEREGVIYGSVNSNGAVTGRMTHSHPNVAQVPAVYKPYGKECRSLFVPRLGALVGIDASGLELRCLAHYMARWDGGEYGEIILKSDIHSYNRERLGLPEEDKYRDLAKRFVYAFLYGAGNAKLGELLKKGAGAGGKLRKTFLANLPALSKLQAGVQAACKRGYLIGLDGRHLHVRSPHSALNTLLQGAGAIVMKKALAIFDADLQQKTLCGLEPGVHYEFCANIHDEWQVDSLEGVADAVGSTGVEAIKKAGEHFKFRCPLDGEYKIGQSWAETH